MTEAKHTAWDTKSRHLRVPIFDLFVAYMEKHGICDGVSDGVSVDRYEVEATVAHTDRENLGGSFIEFEWATEHHEDPAAHPLESSHRTSELPVELNPIEAEVATLSEES